MRKQNLTLSLNPQTIRKAKALADKHSTSTSELLTAHIEALVDGDHAYKLAQKEALALMEHGFHLGGNPSADREGLHSRARSL